MWTSISRDDQRGKYENLTLRVLETTVYYIGQIVRKNYIFLHTFFRLERLNSNEKTQSDSPTVINSYDDLLEVLYALRGENEQVITQTIEELCKGLVGWPGFENVFTVSALHGDGVEDLNQYLVEKAYPSYGYWEYNQDLLTIKVNVMIVYCLPTIFDSFDHAC